ncbi:ABC-2 family transporter protein [Geoglobus ahangari]|uniref:ABC-2 family transporter protein n=2 Tax=Geoglobus ahangari TaxID=113653 RepID=A0A0F7IFP1_9EURY|nr:ABC-2 family transporter protein [Geoglobus ahangari]
MRSMILKDLRLIGRERTIMSAMAILVFIASFSSIITFGLLVLYKPDFVTVSGVEIGIAGDCPILKTVADGKNYRTLDDALKDFYAGEIGAIIYLPNENLSATNFVTVFLPKDEITGIVASSKVKDTLKDYQRKMREIRGLPGDDGFRFVSPDFRRVEVKEGSSITFRFIYAVLIPLLVITTAIISGGLVVDLISEEHETRTLEVVLSTPMSFTEFISAKVVVSLTVSATLTLVWMILLWVNIGLSNPLLILLPSLSFSMIFASLGVAVTSILKDRERSQLVFSLIAISLVTASFTTPSMMAGVVARVSAGSQFSAIEFLAYPIIGSVLCAASVLLSEKLYFWRSHQG